MTEISGVPARLLRPVEKVLRMKRTVEALNPTMLAQAGPMVGAQTMSDLARRQNVQGQPLGSVRMCGSTKGLSMKKIFERVFRRHQNYRRFFLDGRGNVNPSAEIVLADLKRFCRVETSTVVLSPVTKTIDPLALAMAEGRREVWNRIQQYFQRIEIAHLKEENE